MIATITVVAFVVLSCDDNVKDEEIDFSVTPLQTVTNMFAYQTKNGEVVMSIESPLMNKYKDDNKEWEVYSGGFHVFAYRGKEVLESEIKAENAIHTVSKNNSGEEEWKLYGHVFIRNVIKNEIMTTDTLYWDRHLEKIHTDCYVRLTSPQGLLQGYGMESDERATNSIILNPFDSFGRKDSDSEKIVVDTVNFIGPRKKK